MKLVQLLNKLAAKSGILATDPDLVALLAKAELKDQEIPDSLANPLEQNLMDIEAAKNNSTVKAHFTAQALNGVDAELANVMRELGVPDAIAAEIGNEKTTAKRASTLVKKMQELEIKKFEASGKGDKAALQIEINSLNDKLALIIKDHSKAMTDIQSKHEGDMLNMEIGNDLAGLNYALPKEMSVNLKISTAQAVLAQTMAAAGLKIVKENGVKKLVKTDGTEYFDSAHKKVEFGDYVKTVLDSNKLLAVANSGNQNQNQNGNGNQNQNRNQQNNNQQANGQGTPSAQPAIDFMSAQLERLGEPA